MPLFSSLKASLEVGLLASFFFVKKGISSRTNPGFVMYQS
jgi:hypothetical protein